ncbi:zinc finger MYM-type protein 1-like isoform 1-T2 [Discoglossus pictus]
MNTIDSLLVKPFGTLTYEEKLEVIRLGPDQPEINLQQIARDRGNIRTFNTEWYKKNDWLCGSVSRKSLYCFPCILFGGDAAWTKTGVTDVKHLADEMAKHETSKSHLDNRIKFEMLGQANIAVQLDQGCQGYKVSIQKHNEEVSKNRYILSKIIDCIRFCGAFELALRGHDESETSLNPGVFRGLVDLVGSIDSAMEQHLKTATVFKGMSKTVQNELLDCMHEVIKEVIHQELKEAQFVAIQADETTDISARTQCVVVYRYIDKKHQVVERFDGFTEMKSTDADSIAAVVLESLNTVLPEPEDKKKLIAQSYDGASVMRGDEGGVQRKIKDVYPNAHYVHCYAHQLNLIMEKAVSRIGRVRVFFSNIGGIPSFFSRSPKRTGVLDEVVGRRLPRGAPTRWNFNVGTVNVIYENRDALLECFQTIEACLNFDPTSIREAARFVGLLEDREFLYFLKLFHLIMPHVDILYSQLQKPDTDTVYIHKVTEEFVSSIQKIRNSVDEIEASLPSDLTVNRRSADISTLRQLSREVCDIVVVHAKERFSFSNHLVSAKLVQSDLYTTHDTCFPTQALEDTVQAYPILKKKQLRNELSLLYGKTDFHACTSAVALHKLLHQSNLQNDFTETVKLLRILITTPMTTAESERCFSTLKRIKTFLRSTMSLERLNALAMLSMEKQLISEIPDFNEKTIEKFCSLKDRCDKFKYK